MPFQDKNSIKLETGKAFVIVISWVTKQNERSVSSLTLFYSKCTKAPGTPSATNLRAFHKPLS